MFQEKIVESSIKNLDENKLLKAYDKFKKFQDKKDAIKTFKEEVYQDGFLKDVFENALGYTLDTTNPVNFNLKREMKNETDAKKADGVIIVNNEVIGVIELKDTNTKDLNKVENQAFNYHNSHANSRFIIISNFAKLRFYIDKKVEFIEFDLFNLNFNEFKKLYLLLSFESIKNQIPLILKEKSLNFENEISKKLYKDYSNFRLNLFENLIINNPQVGKHELLSHTSKLCDRIIFILFAEDKALLKPNTIKTIEEDFKNQKYTNFSLYEMYKFYFNAINKGDEKLGIKAYNGGLFASDEALDNLLIDDDALNASKLSQYDFASEISVNILGHIFEQSLNDLEEITANIHGDSFDKTKSQRKKDGIFYTPEFITKFIVSKTLGEICKPKREILENLPLPKNQKKLTKKDRENLDKIYAYKDFLLKLKILDPACGSGAFLNEAMNFLINEHKFCDDLRREFDGDALGLFDAETAILENNLYGVDINQTATEIAKLSLWLRSAQVGRKLTNLSNNIKTANSLLDFPFKDIKFDAVIGNPPYVSAINMDTKEREQILNEFDLLKGSWDLYLPFLLKGQAILKDNGFYGWIIPNKFLVADYAKPVFNFLKNNSLKNIINISALNIFEDANVYPIIIIGNNDHKNKELNHYEIKKIEDIDNIEKHRRQKNIFKRYKTFKDYDILINSGTTGFEAKKIIPLINENKDGIKFIVSGTIDPYILLDKKIPYMKKNYNNPYIICDDSIIAKSKIDFWNNPKIVVAGMTKRLEAFYSEQPLALGVGCYGIYDFKNFNPKFLLLLLNSKFLTSYLRLEFKDKHLSGGYLAINKSTIEQLPLIWTENQKPFENLANELLNLNENLKTTKNAFLNELNLDKLPKTLENFELLEFDEFIDEFTKALKLKFKDKLDERNFKNQWERIFMHDKNEVLNLQSKISKLDKNADDLVYKLFDLSDDEIKFIENEMR